jgi:hypothetical protein
VATHRRQGITGVFSRRYRHRLARLGTCPIHEWCRAILPDGRRCRRRPG